MFAFTTNFNIAKMFQKQIHITHERTLSSYKEHCMYSPFTQINDIVCSTSHKYEYNIYL